MHPARTLAFGLLFCLSSMPAWASTGEIARVVALTPLAHAEGASGLRELALKSSVYESDEVRTGEKGMVQLLFNDDTTMTLDAGSVVSLQDFGYGQGEEPAFAVDMSLGLMRMITGEVVNADPEAFSVKTPHATIGIRGTGFSVAVSPDSTLISAFQLTNGRGILVRNEHTGELSLLDSTSLALLVGPEGSQLIPLPSLNAVDSQFIARPSLSGIQNGANPDDGLGGSDREDSLLDFGQIAVPGMGQNGDDGNGSGTPDEPVVPDPAYTSATVSMPLSGASQLLRGESWEGEASFTAALDSGELSNGEFTLNAVDSRGTTSGTIGSISGTGGSGSVTATRLAGAFTLSGFTLSGNLSGYTLNGASSTATLSGSMDLTGAEETGIGSATLDSGDIFFSGMNASGGLLEGSIGLPYTPITYTTAAVTVPLSGYSTELSPLDRWSGELAFTADLGTGAASDASFSLSGTAGSVSASGGEFDAQGTDLQNGSFRVSFDQLEGSFKGYDGTDYTADSGNALIAGIVDLSDAERTGRGTGSMTELNILMDHTPADGGGVVSLPINRYLTAEVTGALSGETISEDGITLATWEGSLRYEASIDNGMPSNASFSLSGVTEAGDRLGTVEGVGGVHAGGVNDTLAYFSLNGFTLNGSAVDASNRDSVAEFDGIHTLDANTLTGTAQVMSGQVNFMGTDGSMVDISF